MIVAEQKKLEEIMSLLGDAEKVLIVGCGTCVTVCFAGGENLSFCGVGFGKSAAPSGGSLRLPDCFDALAAEPGGPNGTGQQLL